MKIDTHIAYPFLTNEEIAHSLMLEIFGKDWFKNPTPESALCFDLVGNVKLHQPNKNYYITDAVVDKLDMLRVKKGENNHFDWTVFNQVKPCKKTFIFSDNSLVRILVQKDLLFILRLEKVKDKSLPVANKLGLPVMNSVCMAANIKTGELSNMFDTKDAMEKEELIYKTLCFIFLTDNAEEILGPGCKKGTMKQGKIVNSLPFPLTIVTSKWNTTIIRTEDFAVSGHFRLQRIGHGRQETKMIFIEPFVKHGYKRTY